MQIQEAKKHFPRLLEKHYDLVTYYDIYTGSTKFDHDRLRCFVKNLTSFILMLDKFGKTIISLPATTYLSFLENSDFDTDKAWDCCLDVVEDMFCKEARDQITANKSRNLRGELEKVAAFAFKALQQERINKESPVTTSFFAFLDKHLKDKYWLVNKTSDGRSETTLIFHDHPCQG